MSTKPRRPGSGPKPPRKINPLGNNRLPEVEKDTPPEVRKSNRRVSSEVPEERRYRKPESLPPAASREQLLVALSELDPLAQEVMIAKRIASFPVGDSGIPVTIPRAVRGNWAHFLRQVGLFCIPELATHEIVEPDVQGVAANFAPAEGRPIDRTDLWEYAKQQNPQLAAEIEAAKTPAQKQAAMRKIASGLPVDMRIALDRLVNTDPSQLEPT